MSAPRLPPRTREGLDEAQRAVWDRIASGARGGVGGPFLALLGSPELCARVEQLGVFVRYECGVPMRLREIAILCVGQHWRADYEWYAHAPIAESQGVPSAVIAAIGAGAAEIPFDHDPDRVVVAFARALLRCGTPEDLREHPDHRLRLTIGLRKVDGRWVVTHEHHSFADTSVSS